jgi:hypothetical protein
VTTSPVAATCRGVSGSPRSSAADASPNTGTSIENGATTAAG